MRILYVTNGFPYPLTSGYLRHYFLIRELAARHSVTLFSIVGADFVPEHAEAMGEFTEGIRTFASASRSRSRRRKVAERLRGLVPGARDTTPAHRLGLQAAELAARLPFDVVLFSGKRTYPALARLADLPVVADMCDATSLHILRRLRVASPLRRPRHAVSYLEVRRIERAIAARAAHLLFASRRDRDELLARLPGVAAPAAVVPNGVDIGYWRRTTSTLGDNDIVMTGAMDYPPNEDAALLLIDGVLPVVREATPDARLWIVGRDPTARLRKAGAARGATVTGRVDDVRPYLERASVFAAPLRFGAGIQNKVLEAMAMEVPVVASTLAADGLTLDSDIAPPVQVADEPAAIAAAIIRQLRAARAGAPPATDERRFVSQHFSWEASGAALEAILRETVGSDRVPVSAVGSGG